jgi:hypothetical protein
MHRPVHQLLHDNGLNIAPETAEFKMKFAPAVAVPADVVVLLELSASVKSSIGRRVSQ